MSIFSSLAGSLIVELTSADVPGCISEFNSAGIELTNIYPEDALTVQFGLKTDQFKQAKQIAEKSGSTLRVRKRKGIYWDLKRLNKRFIILMGIVFVIALTMYLPTRVLFFQVSGNESVPAGMILEAVQKCGITFGSSREKVRSEVVKNKLLEILPQLQWAGINTKGCTAIISVSEKDIFDVSESKSSVSSIVAATDGIIQSFTATKGNAVCTVGQAVKQGQVLISGYTDCGLTIRATQAEGEVYALTRRSLYVVCPTDYMKKTIVNGVIINHSIIFGKKRINLSKNSGIPMGGCDKITKEYPLTLPGGLALPVVLVEELYYPYTEAPVMDANTSAAADPSAFALRYLTGQMIGGTVVGKTEEISYEEDNIQMHGQYICIEMIGRVRYEEILDGKDH